MNFCHPSFLPLWTLAYRSRMHENIRHTSDGEGGNSSVLTYRLVLNCFPNQKKNSLVVCVTISTRCLGLIRRICFSIRSMAAKRDNTIVCETCYTASSLMVNFPMPGTNTRECLFASYKSPVSQEVARRRTQTQCVNSVFHTPWYRVVIVRVWR